MAVGNALRDMYNEVQQELAARKAADPGRKIPKPKAVTRPKDRMVCPECGEPLVFEGGCNICKTAAGASVSEKNRL